MSELRKWIVGAVIVMVAVSLLYQLRTYVQNNEYERRVDAAEQYADSLAHVIASESERADSAEARATALANRVLARDTVFVRERAEARDIAAAAPDTCAPVVAAYERVLAIADSSKNDALAAFEAEREATAALRIARDAAVASRDTLRTTLDSRPGPRLPFIPRLGAGLFAGVCADGRACVGAGVTLSWGL